MEEQQDKKTECKPEKKMSRTTLTFYIVGLFSVALALILISYIAQTRADRQLDTLASQLTEQQTVAQGAAQKLEELQKQLDGQGKALENVRNTLETDLAKTDVAGAVKMRMEEREVYALLARISTELLSENEKKAKSIYDELVEKYGEDRLLGNATEKAFGSDINKLFEAVQKIIKTDNTKEKDSQ